MRRRLLLAAALLLAPLPVAGPAAAHDTQVGELTIVQPWSRAAGQGGTGAGFLAIANHGAAPDRLVAASSPAARTTEMHTHVRDGEVMRMRPVPAIELPAGQTVTLQPGGLHLMLIGLARPLKVGDLVPVTLRFERAGEVRVELHVAGAGARGPAGQMPQGGTGLAPQGAGGQSPQGAGGQSPQGAGGQSPQGASGHAH